MDIPALNSHPKASVIPFEKLAANPNVSDQDKVKEASRQFEAVLLRQILGEARKSSHVTSSGENPNISGIYDDMIVNQMADNISKTGAFGLAKSLQTQLVHQVLPKAGVAAANAAPGAPQNVKNTHQ